MRRTSNPGSLHWNLTGYTPKCSRQIGIWTCPMDRLKFTTDSPGNPGSDRHALGKTGHFFLAQCRPNGISRTSFGHSWWKRGNLSGRWMASVKHCLIRYCCCVPCKTRGNRIITHRRYVRCSCTIASICIRPKRRPLGRRPRGQSLERSLQLQPALKARLGANSRFAAVKSCDQTNAQNSPDRSTRV